jgi:hypothetical protein
MFHVFLKSHLFPPQNLLKQEKNEDYLLNLRQLLNNIHIRHQSIAHFLCRLIPVQCPFEKDIYLFGRKIAHIPPLCKLNPFYEEVVALRFRALCYLADECGQDVRHYC